MKRFPTLYARAKTGKVQQWTIIADGDAFYTESGQVGGKIKVTSPNKCVGKNVGKANETRPEEQAILEAQAKWEKKIKENYKEDVNKIDEIEFFKPMLADKFRDRKDKIKYPVAYEDKLNGGRAVTWDGKSGLWMYSRKGELFNCVDHIVESVKPLFEKYPNLILDGEIFNYQLKNQLNKIMSLVSVNRKPEDITDAERAEAREKAQYHVYDGFGYENITKDTPYEDRKAALEKLVKDYQYVFYVGYKTANSETEVNAALEASRLKKEEGIMVKLFGASYEQCRSKNLLKLKNFEDDEFEVVGFTEGSGDWAGCVKTTICKLHKPTPDGKTTFETNMRGTMEELAALWKDRDKHVGKMITVQYQELSPYGVPLIPYADALFRDYE